MANYTNLNDQARASMIQGRSYRIRHMFMGVMTVFVVGYADNTPVYNNGQRGPHIVNRVKLMHDVVYNGEVLHKGDEVWVNRGLVEGFELI